jgi:predicted aspartyl protease
MKIPYRNNLPLVDIKIVGKDSEEVEAHLDFAASKTIIPSAVADALGLKFVGFEKIATGSGVILMPEYEAAVEVFNKKHEMFVGCLDLPKETPIKALLGRDILDNYEICLNGKTKEIVVKQ